MSTESIRAFLDKLQQDPALQAELRAKFGVEPKDVSANDLATFAAGKGYRFRVEELQGELDEQELGAVAGGLRRSLTDKW